MKTRKNILLGILILLLILFAYVFRTFLLVNIIEPAAFVLWAAWRVLQSINQNVYWQILIWGSVFLLIRFLPTKKASQTAYQHRNNNKEIGGSLYWHHLLLEAQFSMEKRNFLRFELKSMLINTLALQQQVSRETVQTKFNQKQYAFPDFVYQYLCTDGSGWKAALQNQWLTIVSYFPAWLQQSITNTFITQTRQTINWMQTHMESGYENPTLK
jgi:hypothetical protein